ncbi:MAG TPA: SRPBCC family protein [Actinomycetota bacterium]|nr:SRPBCC family protein [Actinomycetota bacterium]
MADEGQESIHIEATPEKVLDVVADVEAYPSWMSAFKKAAVEERDDAGRPLRASFEVDAMIKTVEYTLEYTYADGSITWRSVDGNVKQIDGGYTVVSDGDGSLVTYDYAIDPGFSVPGFLRRQGVKMMVSTALNDLKKRAEA